MKLEDREWREFFIAGEDGIFDITSSSSGIDKNKLQFSDEKAYLPYITRSEENNGINLFIQAEQQDKYEIDNENVITIGLDTQTVFYQPYRFYTGQNIQVLRHEKLNKYVAKFVIPLIKVQMEKFNWGGNGATLGRLFKTKLMFPINKNNQPDYSFMESYSKSIFKTKEEKYLHYIEKSLKRLVYKKIVPLQQKEWREFFIVEIFDSIQRGKRLTKANQIKGTTPYISSTASNNGIDNFIGNHDGVRIFSNCLTIANSGSVGASFYHPYTFVASDHVTHLKQDNFSEYVYIFMATITNRFSKKYNFNREINDARISREKILLPINDKEEPDYAYMEQYIQNMKYKKIKQYLAFKDIG